MVHVPSPQNGRPRLLTSEQARGVLQAAMSGSTRTEIARTYGISRRTVTKIVKGEAYSDVTGQTPADKEN